MLIEILLLQRNLPILLLLYSNWLGIYGDWRFAVPVRDNIYDQFEL